jgi:hypothetical protein
MFNSIQFFIAVVPEISKIDFKTAFIPMLTYSCGFSQKPEAQSQEFPKAVNTPIKGTVQRDLRGVKSGIYR